MKKIQNSWCGIIGQLLLILLSTAVSAMLSGQERIVSEQKICNAATDEMLVVGTDLVSFNVSVTDRSGRALAGLGRNSFAVFDNKQQQELVFFDSADAPASVSIVFDTSGSMDGEKIEQARKALARFIRTSHKDDEFFLIDFNSRARLLIDRSRDADALLEKFTNVKPNGETALFDAVGLGIEKAERGSRSKKIVLVISDGEDNRSRMDYGEIKRRIQESKAMVYTVGVGARFTPKGQISGQELLKNLASISGGKAIFPSGELEMDEAFERIALDIRHLYSIGYYPTNLSVDGNKHRVEVKVNLPEKATRVIVRSRKVYYVGSKP
jgi:Ca-activated chloride channel family protein